MSSSNNQSTGTVNIGDSLNASTQPGNPLYGFQFAADWLRGEPAATALLPQFGSGLDSAIRFRCDSQSWEPWSSEEVDELRQFNMSVGNGTGAPLSELLARPQTLAVVTGQQPNLLASPLYILHKALSAVAWASKVRERTHLEVIPIFWVASDDHDFEELRSCWKVAPDGALVNVGSGISRGENVSPGSPAFLWKINPATARFLANSWNASPSFVAALEESRSFEDLFCRTLSALLGPEYPVLFVVPRLASLRRRQQPILAREFPGDPGTNALVSEAGKRMQAAGYRTVMQRSQEVVNAFYLQDGMRRRIVRRDGTFQLQDPTKHTAQGEISGAELLRLLNTQPENFTTNVVTRPLLQDSAFPSVAYVAGPGELAYLAQLEKVYETHNIIRSAVGLRSLLTLIHTDTARTLRELDLEPTASLETARERLLESTPETKALLGPFEQLQTQVAEALTGIDSGLPEGYAHLAPALRKTRYTIDRSIARLRQRIARQARGDDWNRIARAVSLLSPRGQSQERWLSPFNFLLPGDPSALSEYLMRTADYTRSEPQVVDLSGSVG